MSALSIGPDAIKAQNEKKLQPQAGFQTATSTQNPAGLMASQQSLPNNHQVASQSTLQGGLLPQQPSQLPVHGAIAAAPGQLPPQFFLYNGQLIPISALQPVVFQPPGVNVPPPSQQPRIISSPGVSPLNATSKPSVVISQHQQQEQEQKPVVSSQPKVAEAQTSPQTPTLSPKSQENIPAGPVSHENMTVNTAAPVKADKEQESQEESKHLSTSTDSGSTTQSPVDAPKKERKSRSLFGGSMKIFNEMKQALKLPSHEDSEQTNDQSDHTSGAKSESRFIQQLTKGVEDLVRGDKNSTSTSAQANATQGASTTTNTYPATVPVQTGSVPTVSAAPSTSTYAQYPDSSGYTYQAPTAGYQDQQQPGLDASYAPDSGISGLNQPQTLILQGYGLQAQQYYGTLPDSVPTGYPAYQSSDYGYNAMGAYAGGGAGQENQDQALASDQGLQTQTQEDPYSTTQSQTGVESMDSNNISDNSYTGLDTAQDNVYRNADDTGDAGTLDNNDNNDDDLDDSSDSSDGEDIADDFDF